MRRGAWRERNGELMRIGVPAEVKNNEFRVAITPSGVAELTRRGHEVVVQAGDEGIRFLLVSGKPLEEPVAWYGPIVMNTQQQLRQAFEELEQGTFLKPGA